MKGILTLVCITLSSSTLAMECTQSLKKVVTSKLKSDQILLEMKFKKLMAPKERFIDYELGNKMIVNRYLYPVYYYYSVVDSEALSYPTRNVYLLSPNSCKIMKRGSIVMN